MFERLAKAAGKISLVLHVKDGKIFYDSTWITGVNYTDDLMTHLSKASL